MEREKWILIRPTKVWVIRRMNTQTKLVTIMSVHISRREAIHFLGNIKRDYFIETGESYKFVITREIKKVETTIRM